MQSRTAPTLLIVFVIAVSGLVYELTAGTVSSYLLGDSVYHFSLVIGLFMSAMGAGSYLSRYVPDERVEETFVGMELLLSLVGGTSALLLFASYAWGSAYGALMVAECVLCGLLIGMEIPLLARSMRRGRDMKHVISDIFAFDYMGALAASILFPLVFVPKLGLVRTSLLFGLANAFAAALALFLFSGRLSSPRRWKFLVAAVMLFEVGLFFQAARLERHLESSMYEDTVVFSTATPYQRIVITNWKNDMRLFIDGNLQFSSLDEYRYHESLVVPPMEAAGRRAEVLLLGGGDGLAAREILKYRDVRRLTVVDLDPAMTDLAVSFAPLVRLNRGSFTDPRVKIVNEDAFRFLEETDGKWNVIIVDLPDPNNLSLGKLYTRRFYKIMLRHLCGDGAASVQSTSPYFAPRAFWCIHETISSLDRSVGEGRVFVLPYHAFVPTFGDWGFMLLTRRKIDPEALAPSIPVRFLSPRVLRALFVFPLDTKAPHVGVNTLNNQILVRYYREGWQAWN